MNRSICIPGVPPVDISHLERIIDTEQFQALRGRKQLGINHLVFPGAVHTRFEHAIGVLSLSQRLCTINKIPKEDAIHIQAFALLHDIGHGPFSHQIEPVLSGSDHHQQGMAIVRELADELAKSGIDAERIAKMFRNEDALACWISDRNLGVDKLDYLSRDALHIGFMGTPDIERIQYYTSHTPDGLAIEEKYIEDGKRLQKFYSYLHQHGYLNKTALAAQRMLQRACAERLKEKDAPSSDEIWRMDDAQLIAFLSQSDNSFASRMMAMLSKRKLYRSFLVIKATGYGYVEREADKSIAVLERPRNELRAFCAKVQSTDALRMTEDRLAEALSLEHGSILFAAMPYFRKLIPKDLRVLSSGGHPDYWLFEKDIDHKTSLESDYLRTFAVRLTCPDELRRHLAEQHEKIMKILFS